MGVLQPKHLPIIVISNEIERQCQFSRVIIQYGILYVQNSSVYRSVETWWNFCHCIIRLCFCYCCWLQVSLYGLYKLFNIFITFTQGWRNEEPEIEQRSINYRILSYYVPLLCVCFGHFFPLFLWLCTISCWNVPSS